MTLPNHRGSSARITTNGINDRQKAAAQAVGCVNNQRQLLIAMHTCGADNDGKFPPANGYSPTTPNLAFRSNADLR